MLICKVLIELSKVFRVICRESLVELRLSSFPILLSEGYEVLETDPFN